MVQTQDREIEGSGKGVDCVRDRRDKYVNNICRQVFF